jgi:hypothetical protein
MWRDWLARTLKPQISEAVVPVRAPLPLAAPVEEIREDAAQASLCSVSDQQEETVDHASPLG